MISFIIEDRYFNKFTIKIFLIFITLSMHSFVTYAQIIPIDDIKEEQIRIQQLYHGSIYSTFTNRPVWNDIYASYMNHDTGHFGIWSQNLNSKEYQLDEIPGFQIGVYQPSIGITMNSNVPYGWNNESAWFGRGFNTDFSGGLWISSDFLTITFLPQFTTHQNRDFETPRFIPIDDEGNFLYRAEGIGDIIDRPFRFGPDSFTSFSFGYTSIRAHYKQLEVGYSNEPMWWGGSVMYPLMMSNNAPGMQHFFIGTRAPVKIPYIGKIEFKYIGAFPEDSGYFQENNFVDNTDNLNSASSENENNWSNNRFLNGINLAYSPAFAPNFIIGWSRAIYTYLDEDGLKPSDLGMIFDPILLKNFLDKRGPLDMMRPRNHLTSVYTRWIWPESQFELYGEYFRDDFSWDSRDFLMEPRHNSGYSFGLQKLVVAPYAHFYRINLEFTNMTPSLIQEVRLQNYYYTHPVISEGHTNRGQLLGAAIGPGSNSQYLSIDSYQDWGRFGLYIRRLADNNHFHFNYDRSLNRPEEFRQGYGDYWRNRTDLTLGIRLLKQYNNFLFQSDLSWTKLYNYGRFDYGQFGGLNISNFDPYDVTNTQFRISVEYQF